MVYIYVSETLQEPINIEHLNHVGLTKCQHLMMLYMEKLR